MKSTAPTADIGIGEALLRAKTIRDLRALMSHYVGGFGFSLFALGTWNETYPGKSGELLSNYPSPWRELYFTKRHFLDDPVLRRLGTTYKPFAWGDILDRSSGFIGRKALEYGLMDGICVPVHSASGTVLFALFSSPQPLDLSDREMAILSTIACSAIFACLTQAHGSNGGDYAELELTEREIECLQWAALGKSSWDIGSILGIRPCTVEYHLRKSMRKFDVSSRRFAVAKAINAGLISV